MNSSEQKQNSYLKYNPQPSVKYLNSLYNARGGLNGIHNRQHAVQGLYNTEGQDLNPELMSDQVYNSETSPALMHLCPSFQNNRHLFLRKHRGQRMMFLLLKWDSD